MINRPMQILIGEDNPGDIKLIEIALRNQNIETDIGVSNNGAELLELLESISSKDELRLPDLILLDLNLPKRDGFEVLQVIKRDDQLKHTPVIIFSSSKEPADIQRAYSLGASAFLNKSIDFTQFSNSIQEIVRFWSEVALLPYALTTEANL